MDHEQPAEEVTDGGDGDDDGRGGKGVERREAGPVGHGGGRCPNDMSVRERRSARHAATEPRSK